MGTEAEKNLDQITPEENEFEAEEVETEEVETDEVDEEEGATDDEGDQGTRPEKTFTQQELDEIVLQQKRKVQRRMERLNNKKGVEPDDDTKSQLELERERNKLLTLAMQQATQSKQQPSPDAAPDPDKFDGGEYDPEYKRQYEAYLLKKSEGHVQQILNQERENDLRKRQQEAQARELEAAQRAHYERALTLEVKDYDKHEDRVIEALGEDAFNVIIQGFDDSHALANYLGTPANQAKLDKLTDLVKQGTSVSTAKALAELGRISASLAVNSKSKPAPNPVEPLNGNSGKSISPMLRGAKFE